MFLGKTLTRTVPLSTQVYKWVPLNAKEPGMRLRPNGPLKLVCRLSLLASPRTYSHKDLQAVIQVSKVNSVVVLVT